MKKYLGRLSYLLSERGDSADRCQSFDSMAAAEAAAVVEWSQSELLVKWEQGVGHLFWWTAVEKSLKSKRFCVSAD